MKRGVSVILVAILSLVAFLPVATRAETYSLGGTDMHITVDENNWIVFTRDNIETRDDWASVGISYNDMHGILYNNNVYMDAVRKYEDGGYLELFVQKESPEKNIANLSDHSDEAVEELAEEVVKQVAGAITVQKYVLYKNQYKFIQLDYYDPNYGGNYICEFVTIVNRETYVLKFQSNTSFDEEALGTMKGIVNSVVFDIDPSVQDDDPDSGEIGKKAIRGAVIGAVIGGACGGIAMLIRSQIKKKKESNEQPPIDPTQMQ